MTSVMFLAARAAGGRHAVLDPKLNQIHVLKIDLEEKP